jgi:predicted nucleic acid-binding protein
LSTVLDTSFVVALYDRGEDRHAEAARWYETLDDEAVTTPLAVAEMDYVVPARGGVQAQRTLWRNIDAGAVTVRWWADGMAQTIAIVRRRPEIGLVDASLVALAHHQRTDRIATFDHHFRTLKTRGGKPFKLFPADA